MLILSISTNILIILILFFNITKKIKDIPTFIVAYLISILVIFSVSYISIYKFKSEYPIVNYKDMITPIVTTLGLIVTISISYINIRFNQRKQEIDMILSLIKEQKNLINDDVRSLCDSIAKKCQDELTLANISYMRLVNFIKENKNEIENISDRDIEIIVLISWKHYFENLDKNLLNYNKIAKSNTNKLINESTKKYAIKKYATMGRNIFENNINDGFLKLGTTEFPLKSLTNNVTYEEATKIINNVYHINYDKLGHFFKHFHRIIRLILEGTISHDTREQRDLIGILRAQFSEKLLVLLYYNATYTSRGYGLGMLLQGSYFFGDTYDFNIDYSGNEYLEITHISSSKLYFPDLDSKILKNIYGKGNLIKIPKKNSTNKKIENFLKSIKNLQQEN